MHYKVLQDSCQASPSRPHLDGGVQRGANEVVARIVHPGTQTATLATAYFITWSPRALAIACTGHRHMCVCTQNRTRERATVEGARTSIQSIPPSHHRRTECNRRPCSMRVVRVKATSFSFNAQESHAHPPPFPFFLVTSCSSPSQQALPCTPTHKRKSHKQCIWGNVRTPFALHPISRSLRQGGPNRVHWAEIEVSNP